MSDKKAKMFIKLKILKKTLAFISMLCYHLMRSGCGAAGSALDWGSRGREFKSRHSDHIEYS